MPVFVVCIDLRASQDDEISEEASKNICVISGLTSLGIPKLAYEEADRRCWKTVGIACEKAYDYELYPVDEKQIVGKDWGDESETFLSEIDILVCIGGGKQSKSELKTAKDKGIKTYFYELESED